METRKFRRGDIIFLKDDKGGHPCLIIDDKYVPSTEFGGHGRQYQVMEFSSTEPKKFGIPMLNCKHNQTSWLIPNNVYTKTREEIMRGRYLSYVSDNDVIDMAIHIFAISHLSSMSSNYVKNIMDKYNSYINGYLSKYGKTVNTQEKYTKIINNTKSITGISVSDQYQNDYNDAMSIVNDIIRNKEKVLGRLVPRFVKCWVDLDLILFYLLVNTDEDLTKVLYGFQTDGGLKYKAKVVKEEILKRGILAK